MIKHITSCVQYILKSHNSFASCLYTLKDTIAPCFLCVYFVLFISACGMTLKSKLRVMKTVNS